MNVPKPEGEDQLLSHGVFNLPLRTDDVYASAGYTPAEANYCSHTDTFGAIEEHDQTLLAVRLENGTRNPFCPDCPAQQPRKSGTNSRNQLSTCGDGERRRGSETG